MESAPIQTISTVEAVRSALEKDILSLTFTPGERIIEGDLATRYGVSRNTVREAVAHLLAGGLLTKVANKGVSVRRFTVNDVQEIFHLRTLLETEAVKTIIEAKIIPNELYTIVSELESINRQQQWDEYVQADIRFHSNLVSFAGSPRLCKLYDSILTEVKLCIYQTRNHVTVPEGNAASHRILLDAICQGNYSTASKLLKSHIEHVIKRYSSGLIAMDQNM